MGTAFYVSPEMLNDSHAGPEADYWALGCVLYKLLYGRVPFEGAHENLTFQMILNRELEFPPEASEPAKDLIDQLLQLDPGARLIDPQKLRLHPFFEGIDLDHMHEGPVPFEDEFPA